MSSLSLLLGSSTGLQQYEAQIEIESNEFVLGAITTPWWVISAAFGVVLFVLIYVAHNSEQRASKRKEHKPDSDIEEVAYLLEKDKKASAPRPKKTSVKKTDFKPPKKKE